MNLPKEYISVSQLNSYVNCSEKYYRQYICNEAPSNSTDVSALVLGSAVHKTIEDYYMNEKKISGKDFFVCEVVDQIKREKIAVDYSKLPYEVFHEGYDKLDPFYQMYASSLTEETKFVLIDTLKIVMNEDDFVQYFTGVDEVLKTKTAHRPAMREIYLNIVEYFIKNESEIMEGLQVTALESEILHTFMRYGKDFTLKAFIDFMGYSTESFNTVVIDWKTTKKAWNIADAMKRQDFIYSYMIWKTKGVIPVFRYVVFPYSATTGVVKHQIFELQYPQEALLKTEKEIHDIVRGITEGVFFKNESSFLCSDKFCEFYGDCQKLQSLINIREISNDSVA